MLLAWTQSLPAEDILSFLFILISRSCLVSHTSNMAVGMAVSEADMSTSTWIATEGESFEPFSLSTECSSSTTMGLTFLTFSEVS